LIKPIRARHATIEAPSFIRASPDWK